MMRQSEFDFIYYQYMELSLSMTIALGEYKIKNPTKDVSDRVNILEKIDYLGKMIHKLYHMNLNAGLAHGDFIAERKRLLDLHCTEKYHMRKKIADLEKENAELKEQCLKHI